jgi:hypothetical protein
MAIGNQVGTPPFADQGFRNNNSKNETLASSGCEMIQFDRPPYFNSSPTPLSGEKGKPGQLKKRNAAALQPAPRQSVGALSCMIHWLPPLLVAQPILQLVTPR